MAATIAGNVITLDTGGDSTADLGMSKVKVSSIRLVAGGTSGGTVIRANGADIYNATPLVHTVNDIGPQAPVWYDSIVATTLGTNVACFVHIL